MDGRAVLAPEHHVVIAPDLDLNVTVEWKFIDGYTRQLPPPFTLSELMALHVARALARPLEGTPVHDPLAAAFAKIEALLPAETKAMLSRLDGSFVARTGPFKNYARHKELIEIVTQAQSKSRCLDIEYRSFARHETTRRRVAPYRLCYFRTGLYVIGFDDRRCEVRIFALERIQKASVSDESFKILPWCTTRDLGPQMSCTHGYEVPHEHFQTHSAEVCEEGLSREELA